MSLTVSRPRRTVEFCTNLNLKAEHEDALRALGDAQRREKVDPREASTEVREAAEKIRAIEEQMRGHTVVFTLEAWPRKRWAEFEETHPPREGREDDKTYGLDLSALDDAIAGSIVAVRSLAGEDVDFDAADWAGLADEMTDGQWQDFAVALLNVNRGVKAAPFSVAASRVTQRSEPSSN